MKILIADTSYPINSRNEKIAASLAERFGVGSIEILCWNRDNSVEKPYRYKTYFYDEPSPLGKLVRKFVKLAGFGKFLGKVIRQGKYDFVIASHWEVLFLASLYKTAGQKLIYENLDIPTGAVPVRRIMEIFEKIGLRKTDIIIHASRFFQPLYSKYGSIRQILLENKPVNVRIQAGNARRRDDSRLHLVFLGNLRYENIMRNLIDAVRCDNAVTLTFHGRGGILNSLRDYAAGLGNVSFTGAYAQDDLPSIYADADVIWAGYPNDDYNVRFAISNKFFECTIFGVPGIYSNCTCLGEYVEKKRIGWSVDPNSPESIRQLLIRLERNRDELEQKKAALAKHRLTETCWEEDVCGLIKLIAGN